MESYINVRVIPRAKRTEICELLADGSYKIRIKESPEKGKANKALLKYLSKILGFPRSRIKIASGALSREKLIQFQGFDKEQLDFILSSYLNEKKDSKKGAG